MTMPARTPKGVYDLFVSAFNAGNLDAVMAMYESGASFVPEPGKLVTGAGAIRETMSGFLALKPTMSIEEPRVIPSGDLALISARWTLAGTGPDGNPVNLSGQSADVLRRQPDGTWLLVIDNPYGVA